MLRIHRWNKSWQRNHTDPDVVASGNNIAAIVLITVVIICIFICIFMRLKCRKSAVIYPKMVKLKMMKEKVPTPRGSYKVNPAPMQNNDNTMEDNENTVQDKVQENTLQENRLRENRLQDMKRKASVLEKTKQLKRLEEEEKEYRDQLHDIEKQGDIKQEWVDSGTVVDDDNSLEQTLEENKRLMDKAHVVLRRRSQASQFIDNVKDVVNENFDDEEAIQRRMQELEDELIRSCETIRHEQLLDLKSTLLPVSVNDSLQ